MSEQPQIEVVTDCNQSGQVGPERPSLPEKEILAAIRRYLRPEQSEGLIYSRTKDGINYDCITVECLQFVNAIISRTWEGMK